LDVIPVHVAEKEVHVHAFAAARHKVQAELADPGARVTDQHGGPDANLHARGVAAEAPGAVPRSRYRSPGSPEAYEDVHRLLAPFSRLRERPAPRCRSG